MRGHADTMRVLLDAGADQDIALVEAAPEQAYVGFLFRYYSDPNRCLAIR